MEGEINKGAVGSSDAIKSACPNCGADLVNPDSLGWCMKCGYSKALAEEDQTKDLLPTSSSKKSSTTLGAAEFANLMSKIPDWFWVLVFGLGFVIGGSAAAHVFLPANPESQSYFQRALWGTVQLGAGILLLIAAQVWAIILVGPKDSRIGPLDCVLSGRLWKLAFQYLPETRRPIWLGSWSFAAVVCAIAIIGGQFWWAKFAPEAPERAERSLVDLARKQQEAGNLEESVKEFGDNVNFEDEQIDDKNAPEEEVVDDRPTRQAVIAGYQTDSNGRIIGLAIAIEGVSGLEYAGTVRVGPGLDQPASQPGEEVEPVDPSAISTARAQLDRLPSFRSSRPFVDGLPTQNITYVRLEMFCSVYFTSIDENGILQEPELNQFVQPR